VPVQAPAVQAQNNSTQAAEPIATQTIAAEVQNNST
jgi:hypothetical protein